MLEKELGKVLSFKHDSYNPGTRHDLEKRNISEIRVERDNDENRNASNFATLCNMIASYLGSGILAIPFAFKESGVITGLLMLVTISLLCNNCIKMLIESKYEILNNKKYRKNIRKLCRRYDNRIIPNNIPFDYQDIAGVILGNSGKYFVQCVLLFTQTGAGIVYLIFIGDNMEMIINWNREEVIIVVGVFLVFMCMFDSVEQLGKFSFVSQIAMICSLLSMIIYAWLYRTPFVDNNEYKYNWKVGPSFPVFFGIAIFSYEGIGLSLPLESSMMHPKKYNVILNITYIIITTILVLFGSCLYGSFGPRTNPSITLNLETLPGNKKLVQIVKIVLSLCFMFTYPIIIIPPIRIMEKELKTRIKKGSSYFMATRFMRMFLVSFSVLISVSVPHFGHLMGIVGSMGSTTLAFTLPCIIYYMVFQNSISLVKKGIVLFTITFGLLGGGISTYVSINQII